ncbi:MAG: hypothetical protein OXB92_09480 [Acidimicrobiaceae bacterium]|nr:hypothetical protein [Acidimicrobiia bacterium]MCY4494072.1 hypothetical protein [Acidimicrobiaceae bacterium]
MADQNQLPEYDRPPVVEVAPAIEFKQSVNSHILKDLSAQPWFKEIATRLQRFLSYEANWNGCGEQPISKSAVKHALVVLHRVALGGPEPVVVPVCDGGIQIEWYYSGTEIEVEISPRGAESIYIAPPDGTCVEHDPQQMDQDIWDKLRAVLAEPKADGVGLPIRDQTQ